MAKSFIDTVDISDTLIERPIGFSIKGKHYLVYHPSLGKIQLISRLAEAVGFGDDTNADVCSFCYKVADEHRDLCLRIVAYSTLPNNDCLDESKVNMQLRTLGEVDRKDLATLLITVFTIDKTEAIIRHFGIDKETERLGKAMKAKTKSKNSFDFGAKSVWGALIDVACERYGWPFDYVLWGISYSNLRLLLADHVKTVYLTDEEARRVSISTDENVIRADDTEALQKFINMTNWR